MGPKETRMLIKGWVEKIFKKRDQKECLERKEKAKESEPYSQRAQGVLRLKSQEMPELQNR